MGTLPEKIFVVRRTTISGYHSFHGGSGPIFGCSDGEFIKPASDMCDQCRSSKKDTVILVIVGTNSKKQKQQVRVVPIESFCLPSVQIEATGIIVPVRMECNVMRCIAPQEIPQKIHSYCSQNPSHIISRMGRIVNHYLLMS